MNNIISAINTTIARFPQGMVTEVNQNCGRFNIYLDADFDDYEYFMEDLNEFLPSKWGFENNLMDDGRCHIIVKKITKATTHFRLIFGNESLNGHVDYCKDNNDYYQDVWYADQNIGDCFCKEHPPVSKLFTDALDNMDLADILYPYYGEDEVNDFALFRNNILIIVNPSDFCDHLVNISNTTYDDVHFSEMKYVDKVSIESLFSAISENGYDSLKVINPNEILFFKRGAGYMFKVHFGDVEIQEAFLNKIYKVAEIMRAE